jgi:two-component system sensor histidine kinase DegS
VTSSLHTTVSYQWRRYISIVRVVLSISAAVLFTAIPVPSKSWLAALIIGYCSYTIWLLFRQWEKNNNHPDIVLFVDLLFVLIYGLHPSVFGLWLVASSFLYLYAFASLLYTWKRVLLIASVNTVYFCLLTAPSHGLWPAATVSGLLVAVLSIHRKRILERLASISRREVLSRRDADMARGNERQRIAADFHDGPLQSFISFQIRLEIIRKLLDRDPHAATQELVELQQFGRAQVTELRAFVRTMQPTEVTPTNLSAVVRETVEHFERDSGIQANLNCGDLSLVDEGIAGELLQIVREVLNNVRKHSKASQVAMSIQSGLREISIAVEDDGSGFSFSGSYNLDELEILRLGPRSIKARVRTLGGDLILESRPGERSSLRINVPNN